MASIEIGQLPLTTSVLNNTQIPVENANVTQKIEAFSLKSYMTTLPQLTVDANVIAQNVNIVSRLNAGSVLTTGAVTATTLVSTVASGTAPLTVASTTQVPNLYASRAAVADTATNGLTTATSFANVAGDVAVAGNSSTLQFTLSTVNTNLGMFGNTAAVPQISVDAKGRILAVSNVAITFPAQTLISNTAEITANTASGTPGLSLTATGVAAGTYGGAITVPQITVDTKGRITGLSSIPVNSTLNTLNVGIPIGTIAIWSGALATIPDGWQLADGTNGTRDLRDRFVVGAGVSYVPAATGGTTDSVVVSHTHTATSTSTFAGAALPTHVHGITDNGHAHQLTVAAIGSSGGTGEFTGTNGFPAGTNGQPGGPASNRVLTGTTGITIQAQSAGTPSGTVVTTTTNSTEGVTASNHNLPPYMALYYIQKMTDSVSINNPINFMSTLGTTTSGGNLVAASGNASISTTTGALVVVGGAGVGGNLNVGGTITMPTMPVGTSNTAVATTAFVQVNGTPTGSLMMWPTASPPTGWLLCNGQQVSRTSYAALFAIVGTIFGSGDGSTTFNVPDYRNRMPVGSGDLYSTGTAGGSANAVVVAHSHTASAASDTHNHYISSTGAANGGQYLGNYNPQNFDNFKPVLSGTTAVANDKISSNYTHSHSITVSESGTSGANANMPPYLSIHFIIKAST